MGTGHLRTLLLAALLGTTAAPSPAAAAPGPPPPPAGEDPSAREWNQVGGNPARDRTVDVEPLRSLPVVAWRRPFRSLSNVVCWGGICYFLDGDLHAVRIADGQPACPPRSLSVQGDEVELSVWQGWILLWTPGGLRGIPHRTSGFGSGWSKTSPLTGPPVVARGWAFAADGEDLHSIRIDSGTFRKAATDFPVRGRIAWREDRGFLGATNLWDDCMHLFTATCAGFEKGSAPVEEASKRKGPPVQSQYSSGGRMDVRFAGRGHVLVDSRIPFPPASTTPRGREERRCLANFAVPSRAFYSDFIRDPVSVEGALVGYDDEWSLISQNLETAGTAKLVEDEKLPHGALQGPVSGARGVLYLGNWAFDLATSRVLWTVDVPKGLSVREVIPAGDGKVLLVLGRRDGSGEILCLAGAPPGGPPAAAAMGAGTAGREPPAGGAPPPAPPAGPPDPGADGLVLRDGTVLRGAVLRLPAGRFSVEAEGGKPVVRSAAEVALAVSGGDVLHVGGDEGIYLGWRRHLLVEWHAALEELFRKRATLRLVGPCREILREARAWDLDPARVAALESSLTAVQGREGAEGVLRNLQAEEGAARSRCRKPFLDAVQWCLERGRTAAAAVLLDDAELLHPGGHDFAAGGRACVPPGFPLRDPDGRLWRRWARELLPSAGVFAAAGDPALDGLAPPWKGRALVLRTDHVRFTTLSADPAVVGPCLRNAEWTVRVLASLLGDEAVRPVGGDGDRLDVRLHATQEEYLAEKLPGGGHAMPWSAGFFSPREGVSRFFVPGGKEGDALGRGLFTVLAHEITHHFLEQRWAGIPDGDLSDTAAPGYWCVEGVARFVEDQVVEMGRRGPLLDDRTVPSLDASSQAAAENWIFRPSELLDMSKRGFLGLGNRAGKPVQLRDTLVIHDLTPLSLYYEQAGATVFYLFHECGDAGRRNFFRYLSLYYRGDDPGPGWKALGFKSAEAFDRGFLAFLKSLR